MGADCSSIRSLHSCYFFKIGKTSVSVLHYMAYQASDSKLHISEMELQAVRWLISVLMTMYLYLGDIHIFRVLL